MDNKLRVKNSSLNCVEKGRINYQIVLDNLPFPITLWELKGEDYFLIYLNKAAEKKIEPVLSPGVSLSKALPAEYKKVFYPLSSSEPVSSQIIIDNDLLLLIRNKTEEDFIEQYSFNYFNEPFKTLIDLSPLSIIITDILGNIEFVNKKFVEITGYTGDEVVGMNPRILKSGNNDPSEYKVLWDTILSGKVWEGQFCNKRKNGELYFEYAIISPLPGPKGKINNFIAIKEDITELKRTANELKQSEKFAGLGKMAAYITHELKTPLASIKMNIDRLEKDKSFDDDSKRLFSSIQEEVARLTNLLKNILQFSNQSSLPFSEINLYKKIENVREFLDPLLNEKGIIILNKASNHNVFADAQQLRSLFIHLIENSIDSMHSGGEIEISSEIKGELCYIYVKDNGCGLSRTKNIFEPFVTTKPTGTGLGLPIVKNIVDKHSGTIRLVSSRPGETIFEIVLPTRGKEKWKNY